LEVEIGHGRTVYSAGRSAFQEMPVDDAVARHSVFVTAVAWIFIVLAGFAAFLCVLQSVMIATMFPPGVLLQGTMQPETHVREFARLFFNHIQLIFVLLLPVFTLTLAAAIGLLKRRNWARIAFIGLMGFGVVWNMAGVALMFYFLPSMAELLASQSPAYAAQSNLMRNVFFVFDFVTDVGFIGLFAWIMNRLASEDVRREFIQEPMN
jgi:hypothetical protein